MLMRRAEPNLEQEFLASGTASVYGPAGEAGSDDQSVAETSGTARFCITPAARW
jgi:hypothetical protein